MLIDATHDEVVALALDVDREGEYVGQLDIELVEGLVHILHVDAVLTALVVHLVQLDGVAFYLYVAGGGEGCHIDGLVVQVGQLQDGLRAVQQGGADGGLGLYLAYDVEVHETVVLRERREFSR